MIYAQRLRADVVLCCLASLAAAWSVFYVSTWPTHILINNKSQYHRRAESGV